MISGYQNIKSRLRGMAGDSKVIIKNVFWAFIIKGLSLIVSFFSVPAYIAYFDNNIYLGVWYTILSVLMWLFTFDFGLGNGIRNNLVKAIAQKSWDDARSIISSGLISIAGVILIMCVLGIVVLQFVDLNSIFNVSPAVIAPEDLLLSVIIVFAAIMLRFILVSVSSIFYALQRSSVNNFLGFISALVSLFYVLIFHFEDPGRALIFLSWAYLISYSVPPILAAIWVFGKELKRCRPSLKAVTYRHSKQIIRIGGIFFFCQIIFTLIVNTDQFLITKLFSPDDTVDYTFYYRLTSLIGMAVMLAITPIWSMVTKAFEEKKYIWLRQLYKKLTKIGLIVIVLEFAFIPFIQPLMNIWLGKATIEVNLFIALTFAIFNGCFIYQSIVSAFVCGLERMKLQAFFYSVGIVLKFAMILILYKQVGNWVLVVWGNILIFLPYCIAETLSLNSFFRKLNYASSAIQSVD